MESDDSRIGSRDKGEWLERTVENILKNADFNTRTQVEVPITDQSSSTFKIDVLADDGKNMIFVECKDYDEPEQKSMWEFIGQLKEFRERQKNRRVIGILAVSKRGDDRFKDWRKKLEQEDSILLDGSMIESFEAKRAELGNNTDFYNYLANFLKIDVKKSPKEDKSTRYRVRLNFRTIEPKEYIGKYDPLFILADIEKKLPDHIKRINFQQDMNSPQILADYVFNYNDSNITKQEKKGFLARLMSKDPYDELLESDLKLVKDIIKKTYGINKDKDSKIEYNVAREGRD